MGGQPLDDDRNNTRDDTRADKLARHAESGPDRAQITPQNGS
jgi:hypothetical protein